MIRVNSVSSHPLSKKLRFSAALSGLLLLWLVLCCNSALAKQMYSWTDANGVKHFSDSPPDASRNRVVNGLKARIVEMEKKSEVSFRIAQQQEQVQVFGFNHLYCEVSVKIDNYAELGQTDRIYVLPGNRESLLFNSSYQAIHSADTQSTARGETKNIKFNFRVAPGKLNAVHDDTVSYLPPFAPGSRHSIAQAFGGKQTHNDLENFHAIDLAMPLGTPVHAAREGRVVQTEQDFHRSGQNLQRDGNRANIVMIEHDDGSLGVYAHLDLESVMVGIGQRVRAGQLLAKSGNTGFSTGPHLHFVVQVNKNAVLNSVPITFWSEQKSSVPQAGTSLAH